MSQTQPLMIFQYLFMFLIISIVLKHEKVFNKNETKHIKHHKTTYVSYIRVSRFLIGIGYFSRSAMFTLKTHPPAAGFGPQAKTFIILEGLGGFPSMAGGFPGKSH